MDSPSIVYECSPRLCHISFMSNLINRHIQILENEIIDLEDQRETLSLRAGVVALSDYRDSMLVKCQSFPDAICQPEISEYRSDEKLITKIFISALANKPVFEML